MVNNKFFNGCVFMKGLYSLILILLFISPVVYAQLSTPNILSSNMVLQQGMNVPIWGYADSCEHIQISFGEQCIKTQANTEGKWFVELQPMKADCRPQQLIIKGQKSNITFDNVVVGEVWLCSGQSNMEYKMKPYYKFAPPAKGEDIATLELKKSANDMIRVFVSPRYLSDKGEWKVSDSESLIDVSQVGYFFGKKIQENLGVPVGIITAALGGMRIEAWTSAEAYKKSSIFGTQFIQFGKIDGLEPGDRYEVQIAPLIPFALKGVLWYQGENNCGIGDRQYAEKYQVMVDSWRRSFNIVEAPFYSVLLGAYIYSNKLHKGGPPLTAEELPIFREQQIKTKSTVSNSDFVIITDLTDNLMDVHSSYKWEVGERLARLALFRDYGFLKMVWSGPRLRETDVIGDSVIISFDHVGEGLETNDSRRLNWFEIAGKNGVFRPAIADVKGKDQVVVYHPEISEPVNVRFGWHETAIPNLVNSEGLPAVPFRSIK